MQTQGLEFKGQESSCHAVHDLKNMAREEVTQARVQTQAQTRGPSPTHLLLHRPEDHRPAGHCQHGGCPVGGSPTATSVRQAWEA